MRLDAARFEILISRHNLDVTFRLGANDLLSAWRATEETADDFAASVEHLAFYLSSDDAKGINNPKAWMLKQLRLGFYAPPPGFVSWEQQQIEKRLAYKQDRLAAIKQARRKEFEADFEIWRLETPEEEKNKHLVGHICTPGGPAAQAILRRAYAELTHRTELLASTEEN